MHFAHQYLATAPFDLYDLTLFDLVATVGSFTAAATNAGLTQSAMTRRIAKMESQLGVRLFDRTTRRVQLTMAGRDLQARIGPLLTQTHEIVRAFSIKQGLVRPELRVGISRSIGLSYLPGFFHAYARNHPEVLLNISQANSGEVLRQVISGKLDAGIVHPSKSAGRELVVTNRFADDFVLIAPRNFEPLQRARPLSIKEAQRLCAGCRWLMIDSAGNTGKALGQWLSKHGWKIEPAMELDSFDLIVNLVSLGTGLAFVPHRVLPIYENRRVVKRIALKERFSRELGVVVRKSRRSLPHLKSFIEEILF